MKIFTARKITSVLCTCALAFSFASTALAANPFPIMDERASAQYWEKPEYDAVIMDTQQIAKYNQSVIAHKDSDLFDLDLLPKTYNREKIQLMIKTATQGYIDEELPDEYAGDKLLTKAQWQQALNNLNLNSVPDTKDAEYAICTDRADVKLMPVAGGWYSEPNDVNYNNLQGAILDPAQGVLILHRSLDNKFAFILMPDYMGWIELNKLAITDRNNWLTYADPQSFAVVQANKAYIGGSLYQMGATIPYTINTAKSNTADLSIPVRDKDGRLIITKEEYPLFDKAQNFDSPLHDGYLPYTRNNILRQAFRFQGDEYGWGGQNNSVDCSAYMQNIYKSMGITLPQDADDQEDVINCTSLQDMTIQQKLATIKTMQPGALIFCNGHVTMYLGQDKNDEPIIIHAVSSYGDETSGKLVGKYLRRISVTGMDFKFRSGKSFLDVIRNTGNVQ